MISLLLLLFAVDPRYHDYQATAAELRELADQHPAICRLETIGFSTTNGWPLLALKVSDHPELQEDEPRILYNGVHHACELIGNEICLYLAHDLLTRYGSDPNVTRWVDSNQVFIVPLVNPDGHAIVMDDRDTMWRKNTHDFNHNGRWDPDTDGVDLNRNYDFIWETGDPNQGSRYYRGTAPFSENETQAIRDLARREQFVFDICFHADVDPAQGEAVYYPWRWGNGFCPDYPEIKTIADSVARRIINDRGNGYYATIYGRATEGALARNWLYYASGTFAYTIEVSLGYQPPGYRVDSICRRVSVGAYYLLDRAHGSCVTGHVTDSLTGAPLIAEVKVREATSTPDTIQPRMSDSLYGRYWHPLRAMSYTLEVSKYGYYPKTIPSVVVQPGVPTVLDVALVRNPGIEDLQFGRPVSPSVFLSSRRIASRSVSISYQIMRAGPVRLGVYDRSGRMVRELVDQTVPAGDYAATWDGRTETGSKSASGVYFVHLASGETKLTRKLVMD
jgi:hypothetical protein